MKDCQGCAHLRGEVARLTRESIQYDELRKQQIWKLEDELARLREQVHKLIARVEKLPKRFKTNLEWPELVEARAALESTTPQSARFGYLELDDETPQGGQKGKKP